WGWGICRLESSSKCAAPSLDPQWDSLVLWRESSQATQKTSGLRNLPEILTATDNRRHQWIRGPRPPSDLSLCVPRAAEWHDGDDDPGGAGGTGTTERMDRAEEA